MSKPLFLTAIGSGWPYPETESVIFAALPLSKFEEVELANEGQISGKDDNGNPIFTELGEAPLEIPENVSEIDLTEFDPAQNSTVCPTSTIERPFGQASDPHDGWDEMEKVIHTINVIIEASNDVKISSVEFENANHVITLDNGLDNRNYQTITTFPVIPTNSWPIEIVSIYNYIFNTLDNKYYPNQDSNWGGFGFSTENGIEIPIIPGNVTTPTEDEFYTYEIEKINGKIKIIYAEDYVLYADVKICPRTNDIFTDPNDGDRQKPYIANNSEGFYGRRIDVDYWGFVDVVIALRLEYTGNENPAPDIGFAHFNIEVYRGETLITTSAVTPTSDGNIHYIRQTANDYYSWTSATHSETEHYTIKITEEDSGTDWGNHKYYKRCGVASTIKSSDKRINGWNNVEFDNSTESELLKKLWAGYAFPNIIVN